MLFLLVSGTLVLIVALIAANNIRNSITILTRTTVTLTAIGSITTAGSRTRTLIIIIIIISTAPTSSSMA